jgi:hypothetical protein
MNSSYIIQLLTPSSLKKNPVNISFQLSLCKQSGNAPEFDQLFKSSFFQSTVIRLDLSLACFPGTGAKINSEANRMTGKTDLPCLQLQSSEDKSPCYHRLFLIQTQPITIRYLTAA